jgi:hypothetical protein
MADTKKLRLIAELCNGITNEEMGSFKACALGRAVQAGILEDKLEFRYDLGGYASVLPRTAAEQLGITPHEALVIFVRLADIAGNDEALYEIPEGFERSKTVAAALIALAVEYEGADGQAQ